MTSSVWMKPTPTGKRSCSFSNWNLLWLLLCCHQTILLCSPLPQHVSFLRRSASAGSDQADHLPLLQAHAVSVPGRHGSAETHALERGEAPRGRRAGRDPNRLVSLDRFFTEHQSRSLTLLFYLSATSCVMRTFLTPMQTQRAETRPTMMWWGCGPSVSGCRSTQIPLQRIYTIGKPEIHPLHFQTSLKTSDVPLLYVSGSCVRSLRPATTDFCSWGPTSHRAAWRRTTCSSCCCRTKPTDHSSCCLQAKREPGWSFETRPV